jgi:hypothetical protein
MLKQRLGIDMKLPNLAPGSASETNGQQGSARETLHQPSQADRSILFRDQQRLLLRASKFELIPLKFDRMRTCPAHLAVVRRLDRRRYRNAMLVMASILPQIANNVRAACIDSRKSRWAIWSGVKPCLAISLEASEPLDDAEIRTSDCGSPVKR